MRLALVVTGGFDRSGRDRVIPSLLWLVSRLARRHDVVVYVLRYHDAPCRYELAGATVHDLGRPRGIAGQYRALLNAVRAERRFDVLHAYWAVPAGLVASLVGRRCGIATVVTCDSGEFVAVPDIRYGLQRSFRTRAAVAVATRLASRVTVASRYQERLAMRHGVRPDVIPIGVDLALFSPAARTNGGVHVRLLNVASLNAVKDHVTLLAALRRLLDGGMDVGLDIVGEDTLDGAIQRHAVALGVADRVVFHGFLPTERLLALYAAADLFVLSSRHEAAGVVLLEAAACGAPIVGSAVGYLSDWSPDLALAVPPHDPLALADAVALLIADDGRRRRMADAARRWALQHDADWTADAFERIYANVVNGSRDSGHQAPR